MAESYELVYTPRISPNDEVVTLTSWSKQDGEPVAAGETICELESSKSTVEVAAPNAGWLFHLHQTGAEISVAKPLAVVAAGPTRPELRPEGAAAAVGVKVTTKARQLIEANGIPLDAFQGIEIVKEQHVRDYLQKRGPVEDESTPEGEWIPLSPIRRRAAKTLAASTQTIPHSYLQRWVDAAAVEARLEAIHRDQGLMVGVFDLLVAATAGAAVAHPGLNAAWHDDGVLRYANVHLGFALNLSNGDLVVPVIKHADQLGFEALAGRIRGLQKAALRNKLTSDDLTGGTVTVTSLVGTGVHQVFPIIMPGQTAIVAVADPVTLPGLRAYTITLAFDHRVVNGSEAAEFLAAVATALEGNSSHG